MHQNHQKSVKTSELEDQYAVILGLAVWPEGPREIDFFKKSWFQQKMSSKNLKNISIELKWSAGLRLGWYLTKIDLNASRKLFKALPGPGEAFFECKNKNGQNTDKQKVPYISPYQTPYQPFWAAAI